MKMTGWLSGLALAALSGCAAYSTQEMHSAYYQTHKDLKKNYQAAYKSIVDKMRVCLKEGYVKGFVDPQLRHAEYPTTRSAQISVSNSNIGGEHFLVLVRLQEIQEGLTRLHVYGAYPDWAGKVNAIEKWVSDANAPCIIESQ